MLDQAGLACSSESTCSGDDLIVNREKSTNWTTAAGSLCLGITSYSHSWSSWSVSSSNLSFMSISSLVLLLYAYDPPDGLIEFLLE